MTGAQVALIRFAALALGLAMSASALAAEPPAVPAPAPLARGIAANKAPSPLPQLLRPSLPLTPDWTLTHKPLRGRVLAAASLSDIVLRPKEVILSFDDGPTTGRTEGVLQILDDFGVKAIFMMVGKMAELHPQSAQAVALDGQTIGTHTYDHANLSKLAPEAAFEEIQHGKDAVAAAIAPVKGTVTNFFRFPYLASTWYLQASLYFENTIVLGISVDSDDYTRSTPAAALTQMVARLDKVGKGIVLFHDIHPKTLVILPAFLQALSDRGYTVVQLVPKAPDTLSQPIITASR